MKKVLTEKSHLVETSQDGKVWYCCQSFGDGPDQLTSALSFAKGVLDAPFVRVTHVTRTRRVMDVRQNTGVMTQEQINYLLTAGKKALEGIPGVTVNEGCSVSFDSGINHSPTYVSVSFHPVAVLGRWPLRRINEEAARAWQQEATKRKEETLALCHQKLMEAKINHTVRPNEIFLKP